MKKKLILILTSAILSIGVISFALISGRDETNYVKAKDEPYTLNLSSLSSSNNTLTTSNGNSVPFEVSGYSDGSFSNNSYIRNTSPISGIESLTVSFETTSADLIISYGWYANNYYSTDGVINSSSNTYYFDEQGPSYFKIENKSGGKIDVTSIQLSYSCSETAAPGVKYTLKNDGSSYSASKYNSQVTNATILPEYKGKPVKFISYNAFSGCASLVSVDIPEGITHIDDGAFNYCSSLSSLFIPSSVINISPMAFLYSSLTSFEVAAGNQYFSSLDGVLFNKNQTTLVAYPAGIINDNYSIPASVDWVESYAFCSNTSLVSVHIPDSVTFIGGSAFRDCSSLSSVNIPSGVTLIKTYVFAGCSSLTSLVIPNNVFDIAFCAFEGCSSLASINIPSTVISIGQYAFKDCSSLTSIVIPNSVASIGTSTFVGCSSLAIYCEADSQPDGWNSNWNPNNCPVTWGYTPE